MWKETFVTKFYKILRSKILKGTWARKLESFPKRKIRKLERPDGPRW